MGVEDGSIKVESSGQLCVYDEYVNLFMTCTYLTDLV